MSWLLPYVVAGFLTGLVWWAQVREARERARRELGDVLAGRWGGAASWR
jgi:hypothetical protein